MKDCLFCEIVNQKIPSYKIAENDSFCAFLDIFPLTKGHTLIVPKKHYRWVNDVPNFGRYWEFAKDVSENIKKALKPEWISYLTHGEVPHAHIHILPRYDNVEKAPLIPSHRMSVEKIEMESIQSLIQNISKEI